MPEVTVTRLVSDTELETALRPRDDVVVESEIEPGQFGLANGPFDRWFRTIETVGDDESGTHTIVEHVDYHLAIPVWHVLFNPIVKRSITRGPRPSSGRPPWWSTPDHLDARAARGLSLLCVLALFAGYMGTLLTQTNTFFKEDFNVSDSAIGTMVGVVRIGALLAMVVVAVADRRGRRTVLIAASLLGSIITVLGAFAPDLATLTVSQTLARAFTAAVALLLAVVAAEEMPAGSPRVCGFRADDDGRARRGHRGHAALGRRHRAVGLASVVRGSRARHLADHPHRSDAARDASIRGEPPTRVLAKNGPDVLHVRDANAGRLILLAVSALCFDLFVTPASAFLNDFLRTDRGFAPWQISVFTILTNTPGGIGIVVGGRLADARGRRLIGAIGLGAGVAFTVLMYLATNWTIWLWSILGSVIGAMAVPALAVYGPELFPTDARGRANGAINVARAAGAAAGAFLAGALADRLAGGLPQAITLLAIGPLIVVGLVLVLYPETAARELEDLNPEDAPLSRGLLGLEGLEPDIIPENYYPDERPRPDDPATPT